MKIFACSFIMIPTYTSLLSKLKLFAITDWLPQGTRNLSVLGCYNSDGKFAHCFELGKFRDGKIWVAGCMFQYGVLIYCKLSPCYGSLGKCLIHPVLQSQC